MKISCIKYAIHKNDESPIFGSDTIHVSVDSEGEGVWVIVEQINPTVIDESSFGAGKMALEIEEIQAILDVAEMLKRDNEEKEKK